MDLLTVTKWRALLTQQCKTEQAVQATGLQPSLQEQPEAGAWERFKNGAST